jgi:hypothetical protein
MGTATTERVTDDTKRLATLKREIAMRGYEVDSTAVARAILIKLRLLRRARAAIDALPNDRTRAADESSHPPR